METIEDLQLTYDASWWPCWKTTLINLTTSWLPHTTWLWCLKLVDSSPWSFSVQYLPAPTRQERQWGYFFLQIPCNHWWQGDSMRSSRYISLVIPKANTYFGRVSFQFSAADDWNVLQKSLKLESYIFLSNFKHQLSEQLTDHCTCTQPIYKKHNQLPHPHIITYPLALLHPSISTCTSSSAHLSLQC